MNLDYSLDDLTSIAKKIISTQKNKALLFYGEMGVGKTTLIKEICKELKIKDMVHSPTFSLINEYRTDKNEAVYHFDFYRIETEQEAYDAGVEDYFYSDNWCLVEWPNNVVNLLPQKTTEIRLSYLDNGLRNIQLKQNL